MKNNWICEITKEIVYCSNKDWFTPESVELRFNAEDVDRIARVMILVKENKLHSAKIDCGGYVLLNDEAQEAEFAPTQAHLIIYEDSFVFYAQDDDCDQIESDSITFDEISRLEKIAD